MNPFAGTIFKSKFQIIERQVISMKKTLIFIVAICLGLTLLTPAPAKAQVDPFWPVTAPLYAAGAILSLPFQIVDSVFCPPGYYDPAPPVVYGGGYDYCGGPGYGYYGDYYGPNYGYYGGYYRPWYGYYGGYYGGHRGGYYGGNYGSGHRSKNYGSGHRSVGNYGSGHRSAGTYGSGHRR